MDQSDSDALMHQGAGEFRSIDLHGGNRAVWDTVGANASQPNLGTPPKVEPIGEWHFGKDGVPVMGPPPNPETPAKPATAETDGRSRTARDSTPGKR